MDVQKQIEYWRTSSEEDIEAAAILCEKSLFRHGLFFAHLALENALKAHVSKQTREVPPKIHNLVRLPEIARLPLPQSKADFLKQFNLYQLEGRYPDTIQSLLDRDTCMADFRQAQELVQWSNSQL